MSKFQGSGGKKISDLDKALISYRGTTTADGGALGVNLICTDLITRAEYNGNQVVIIDGACAGQARDINGTTLAGTVTPLSAFDAQITLGTKFAITAMRFTPAEVATILIILRNVFDLVNALLVLTETGGTVIATGLLTEDNVYINNAPAGVYKPNLVTIDMSDLAGGEVATVRTRYRIEPLGALELKGAPVIFNGVQAEPLKDIELTPNRFGVQVTIEATATVVFPWEVFYKV